MSIIIPDAFLRRNPAAVADVEAHRIDLVEVFQECCGKIPKDKLAQAVGHFRKALQAALPGQTTKGEMLALMVAAAAHLAGETLDIFDADANDAVSAGRIKACAEVFEQILRARQDLARLKHKLASMSAAAAH